MFKKKYIIIVVFSLLILAFVYFQIHVQPPKVVITQPADGSILVSQETAVSIFFENTLTERTTQKMGFEITPKETFEISYSEKSMVVSFKENLLSDTQYTVSVNYNDESICTFSFQSTPFTEELTLKEGRLQAIDDSIFGEAFEKFIEDYPWYIHLPIENNQYRIVYDFEEKSFRIRILVPDLDPAQEETLIQKALEDLKIIGLTEPINYYVINE